MKEIILIIYSQLKLRVNTVKSKTKQKKSSLSVIQLDRKNENEINE